MGLVQKMAVLTPKELCTEVTEGAIFRSAWQVERIEEKVVCPKPQRVATVTFMKGESVKPFWQRRSVLPSTLDAEANHEIMEIFRSKNSLISAASFGCSPPYFSGSPPCRAGNPIVRDVEFSHQRRSPLPASLMHGNPTVQGVEFSHQRRSPLPTSLMHGNPTVGGVEFSHQKQSPLPASLMYGNPPLHDAEFSSSPAKIMQPKSAAAPATFRAIPCVRVEGFDCPGRGFECTSRDTRRHVPALA